MDALVKGEPTDLSAGIAFASVMIDLTERLTIKGIGSLCPPVLEVDCQVPSAVQSVCVPLVGHEEATVFVNLAPAGQFRLRK